MLTKRTLDLLDKALSVWPRVRLKIDYFQMLFPMLKKRGHLGGSSTSARQVLSPNPGTLTNTQA